MRDPARIDKILNILKSYWKTYPDLRFMQMIVNIVGDEDQFFLEDDDFEKFLKRAIKEFDASK